MTLKGCAAKIKWIKLISFFHLFLSRETTAHKLDASRNFQISKNKARWWAIEMWTFCYFWVPYWSSFHSLYGHEEWGSGFVLDENKRFSAVAIQTSALRILASYELKISTPWYTIEPEGNLLLAVYNFEPLDYVKILERCSGYRIIAQNVSGWSDF